MSRDPNEFDELNMEDDTMMGPAEEEGVHPISARMFACMPFLRYLPVFGSALAGFGPSVVFSLFMCYCLSKGAASNYLNLSMQPMLRNRLHGTIDMVQRLSPLSRIGGSLKALTACLTDAFAFFHFTKRWYLVISAFLTAIFCFVYGALPAKQSSLNTAGAMIFLSFLFNSTVDILTQGHFSRLIKRKQEAGPMLISWVNFALPCGAIIAAVSQGPLSDADLPHVGLFIAGGLLIIVGIVFVFNLYEEKRNIPNRREDAIILAAERRAKREYERQLQGSDEGEQSTGEAVQSAAHSSGNAGDVTVAQKPAAATDAEVTLEEGVEPVIELPDPAEQVRGSADDYDDFEEPKVRKCGNVFEFNQEIVTRNWPIFVYSLVISACVITMVCVIILGNTWALLYTMIAISVVCIVGAFLSLPLAVAKATTFLFFNQIWVLNFSSVLTSFYTASPECIADGPHFSYTFYNIIGSFIGNIGTIIGVLMFAYVFSKHKFYIVFSSTTVIYILASFFDLIMVERWNIIIGIPDHALYIFGDAVVLDLCAALADMPTAMLLARLCPRGSESLVYAVVASMGNIGGTLSGSIASVIIETRLPVSSEDGSCDFSNLRWLIVIGHILTPLINIPLSYFLLPDALICEEVGMDGKPLPAHAIAAAKAAQAAGDAAARGEPYSPVHGGENIAYLSSGESDKDEQTNHNKESG